MTVTADSQIKKGQFLVGGKIGFSAANYGRSPALNYKTTNVFISPNIGYFIIDKLAAGARIDFWSNHQSVGESSSTTTLTTLSPFVRYYFLHPAKMVNIFVDISYNNYKNKSTSLSQPSYNTSRSYGYTIAAGPSIFLNQHIALEFTVGYQSIIPKGYPLNKTTQFNTAFGLQIHLGKIKRKTNA